MCFVINPSEPSELTTVKPALLCAVHMESIGQASVVLHHCSISNLGCCPWSYVHLSPQQSCMHCASAAPQLHHQYGLLSLVIITSFTSAVMHALSTAASPMHQQCGLLSLVIPIACPLSRHSLKRHHSLVSLLCEAYSAVICMAEAGCSNLSTAAPATCWSESYFQHSYSSHACIAPQAVLQSYMSAALRFHTFARC